MGASPVHKLKLSYLYFPALPNSEHPCPVPIQLQLPYPALKRSKGTFFGGTQIVLLRIIISYIKINQTITPILLCNIYILHT
jgi:hypothetical protein